MAELIEGLQGSGKSYYATYNMLHDQEKYWKIFSNIDGLKHNNKIHPLEFKKFTTDILDECYKIQVEQDGNFQGCIEFLQRVFVLPQNVSKDNRVLLVIDEAQNYFGKTAKLSPTLQWFITQHRHLFIEVYLITQKYTLLRPEYHLFNRIIKAYPPIKQVNKKKIRYKEYAGLPQNKDNETRTFSLEKEKEVFDMYISGDKVESPNPLKKFIITALIIGALLLLAIIIFVRMYSPTPPTEKEKVEKVVSHIRPQAEKRAYTEGSKLYTFVIWNDGYFYIRGVGENEEYPIKLLPYIKQNFFIKVIDKIKMSEYRTMIYAVCSTELENIFRAKTQRYNSHLNDITPSTLINP